MLGQVAQDALGVVEQIRWNAQRDVLKLINDRLADAKILVLGEALAGGRDLHNEAHVGHHLGGTIGKSGEQIFRQSRVGDGDNASVQVVLEADIRVKTVKQANDGAVDHDSSTLGEAGYQRAIGGDSVRSGLFTSLPRLLNGISVRLFLSCLLNGGLFGSFLGLFLLGGDASLFFCLGLGGLFGSVSRSLDFGLLTGTLFLNDLLSSLASFLLCLGLSSRFLCLLSCLFSSSLLGGLLFGRLLLGFL